MVYDDAETKRIHREELRKDLKVLKRFILATWRNAHADADRDTDKDYRAAEEAMLDMMEREVT